MNSDNVPAPGCLKLEKPGEAGKFVVNFYIFPALVCLNWDMPGAAGFLFLAVKL